MSYSTKATWLGNQYGCRIFHNGNLVVEGRCPSRDLIGATFRDMMRDLDKCGGDRFTNASRHRKWKEGNPVIQVKPIWNWQAFSSSLFTSAN